MVIVICGNIFTLVHQACYNVGPKNAVTGGWKDAQTRRRPLRRIYLADQCHRHFIQENGQCNAVYSPGLHACLVSLMAGQLPGWSAIGIASCSKFPASPVKQVTAFSERFESLEGWVMLHLTLHAEGKKIMLTNCDIHWGTRVDLVVEHAVGPLV